MARKRRNYSSAEKVAALRKHLLEQVPISRVCDELGVSPNLFYIWQKQFFENAEAVFDTNRRGRAKKDVRDEQIAKLEAKLTKKEHVLAELLEEHVALKKELGSAWGG